jgi:hypothetical protein
LQRYTTDQEHTLHAFKSYGGTVVAKYNDGVSGHFMLYVRENGKVARGALTPGVYGLGFILNPKP